MSGDREAEAQAARSGGRAMLPVLVGIVPFAAVAGLAGAQNGLSTIQTAAFSLFAYAGAAQVAALSLIGGGGGVAVVVATALVINLRFAVYSATLAPLFRQRSMAMKGLGSYVLVDHAVALTFNHTDESHRARERVAFYLGACIPFWLTWQTFSLLGSLLGSVPAASVLTFAVPLSFVGLLGPQLRSAPVVTAACAAAATAVAGRDLPANLGMFLGTAVGLAAGAWHGWPRGHERGA